MSYPVAYRTGARANITRSRWVDPKAFTERYIPPKAGIGRDTFQARIPRQFGKRTAAELAMDILERQIAKKAKTAALRFVPLLGEALLVSDAVDIILDGITTVVTYPDAHWEPGVGHPIYSRPGWTLEPAEYHYGSYLIEKTGRWIGGSWAGIYYSEPPMRVGEVEFKDTWVLENHTQLHKWWSPWYEGSKDGDILWSDGDRLVVGPQAKPDPLVEYEPGDPVYVPGEPLVVTTPARFPIGDDLPLSPTRIREVGHGTEVKSEAALDPTRVPALITVVSPTGITSKPGTHHLAPQTKERKVIAAVPHRVIAGLITESLDVIIAFHDALPIQYQHGARMMHKRGGGVYWRIDTYKGKKEKPNHIEALRRLYAHWDKVDMKEAFTNLAKNEIEDRLIGSAAQRTNRSLRKWYNLSGRPVGVFSGSAL